VPCLRVVVVGGGVAANVVLAWRGGAVGRRYYGESPQLPDGTVIDAGYSEFEASKIARQLVSAVDACHEAGVVHRDLKPENILVHQYKPLGPVIKLCDFGLARRCNRHGGQDGGAPQLLYEESGTPDYIAPEILTKEGHHFSSDVWSVAVILYILLCGEQPFWSPIEEEAACAQDVLQQVS
jgi:serine/threonine protein kinase